MAPPISYIPSPARGESAEDRLRQGAAAHADAILSGYEVLQLLQDRGVLELVRGGLGAGGEIVETVTSAVNTPDATRAIRNFILLTKFFGSIPPDVLNSLAHTVIEGSQKKKAEKPPSLWQLFRRLRHENTRYALGVILDLTESFGKGL
jgi:uncharacterized protein YjgD (DUF1641 family)